MDRDVNADNRQNRKYIIRNKMITIVVKSTNNDFETPHSKDEYLKNKNAHYWVCRKLNVLGSSEGWTPISSKMFTESDKTNPNELLVHIVYHLTRQIEDASSEYASQIPQDELTDELETDRNEYNDTEE